LSGTSPPEADGDPVAGFYARSALRHVAGTLGLTCLLAGAAAWRDAASGAWHLSRTTAAFAERFGSSGAYAFAVLALLGGAATMAGLALRAPALTRFGLVGCCAWSLAFGAVVTHALLAYGTIAFVVPVWMGLTGTLVVLAVIGYSRAGGNR
jgi:hypothetical protein